MGRSEENRFKFVVGGQAKQREMQVAPVVRGIGRSWIIPVFPRI